MYFLESGPLKLPAGLVTATNNSGIWAGPGDLATSSRDLGSALNGQVTWDKARGDHVPASGWDWLGDWLGSTARCSHLANTWHISKTENSLAHCSATQLKSEPCSEATFLLEWREWSLFSPVLVLFYTPCQSLLLITAHYFCCSPLMTCINH